MSSDGMLTEPACSRTSVLVTLSCHLMCSRRQRQRRWNPLLLSGLCCPRLAAIKESRQDTSLVVAHLGPFAQQVIAPHSLVEFGHDSSCFDDPEADLSIEGSQD